MSSGSVVEMLNGFSRTMRSIRRLILLTVVGAGAALYAYSAVVNAIHYTKVEARVERVAILCRPRGTPIEDAVDCTARGSAPAAGRVIRSTVAYVRYNSPADGREHQGRIVAAGTNQAKRVRALRPGDSWTILAHDDEPGTIKVN